MLGGLLRSFLAVIGLGGSVWLAYYAPPPRISDWLFHQLYILPDLLYFEG